jgi:hypothetical protein
VEVTNVSQECVLSVFRGEDPAIAQVINRWLSTIAAGIHSLVRSCGICDGKSELEPVFSEYLVSSAGSHSTNCSTFIYHPIIDTL